MAWDSYGRPYRRRYCSVCDEELGYYESVTCHYCAGEEWARLARLELERAAKFPFPEPHDECDEF